MLYLLKKCFFVFLHGICNFDFSSFCKFLFGTNLEAKQYLGKYEKMLNSTYIFQWTHNFVFKYEQTNKPFNTRIRVVA